MLISGKQLKNNSIDLSKLVNLDAGKVIIGQDGDSALALSLAGDVTLTSAGTITLGSVVDATKLASGFLVTDAVQFGVMTNDDDTIPSSLLVKNFVETSISNIPGVTVDYATLDDSGSVASDLFSGPLTDTLPSSAAVKAYVDQSIQGLDVKEAVKVLLGDAASGISAYSISGVSYIRFAGPSTIDGQSVSTGDRVLVNKSSSRELNGIYDLVAQPAGADSGYVYLKRSEDADNTPGNEVSNGMFCAVLYGTSYAATSWILRVNSAVTLDVTELTFVQFSAATQLTIKSNGGLTNSGSNELAIDLTNLVAFSGTLAPTTDLLVINDGATSGGERKITISSVVDAITGNGLTATNGVIAVDGTVTQVVTYSGSTSSGNEFKISSVAFSGAPNGKVQVYVNGISQNVSYSTTVGNGDCFFAASTETSQSAARAENAIVAGDVLFWNTTTAGFAIEANDVITLVYLAK